MSRSLGFAAFFLHFITKAARWFDYVAQRRKNFPLIILLDFELDFE
jgi:hypothetical protein